MPRSLVRILLAAALACGLLAAPAAATFPGTNGPIAFEADRDNPAGGAYGIWTLFNGAFAPATGAPSSKQNDPAISPDGRWVAYAQSLNLFVAPLAGGPPRQVTREGANDQFPAFSPDGMRLVFRRVAKDELFVIGMDGKGLRQLTNDPAGAEYEPAWSPDGSRIAYTRYGCAPGDEGGSCIWSIPAAGGAPALLTGGDLPPGCPDRLTGYYVRRHSSHPSWSPDGRQIAFTSIYDVCTNQGGGSDIWVMSADGSGERNLIGDSYTIDQAPTFSPDGRLIAFASDRGKTTDIWTIPPAGGAPTQLNSDAPTEEDPDWGPLGTCVVPKLKNATLAKARRMLPEAGCRLGKVRKRKGGKPGRVVGQSPKVGKKGRLGTKVALTVSRR
jgi:Tol biopolymer transport system component